MVRQVRRHQVSAGDRYGRLTVVREVVGRRAKGGQLKRRVECRCECGEVKDYDLSRLRTGKTKSCGCLFRESVSSSNPTNYKHGGTGTPEYATWTAMINRCRCPWNSGYKYYGARGIKVCERWFNSFPAFLEDMGPRPSKEYSIDRIDNNGNYEPGNCRWSTRVEQGRNKSTNVMVTHAGETLCVSEWAERYGVGASMLSNRLRAGWSFEDAVTKSNWENNRSFYSVPISKRDAEWYREYERRNSVSPRVE